LTGDWQEAYGSPKDRVVCDDDTGTCEIKVPA